MVFNADQVCHAAARGRINVVRYLVNELGVDVNQARHEDGQTPLFVAAQNNSLDAVRCLVKEFGADVHKSTHEATTPLCVAVDSRHLDVV